MRFYISPLAAVALIVLAITNPTTDEFTAWAKQRIANAQGSDPLVSFITSIGVDPLIRATTERRSFVFFSIFFTRLDDHTAATLGFANNFVPLTPKQNTWRPGSPSPVSSHVIAGGSPGQWKPEDGYVWVVQPPQPNDLRVRWQPGRLSERSLHLVAAANEQRWLPDDGYAWNINPPPVGQLGVHWVSGRPSSKYQHVVTASQEGHWLPASGYRWIVNPPRPGDFRVAPIANLAGRDDFSLSANQRRAGCSISMGELLCPGPGSGLCWAAGHNPYYNEPPMAIDVGNPGSSLYGRSERCSRTRL